MAQDCSLAYGSDVRTKENPAAKPSARLNAITPSGVFMNGHVACVCLETSSGGKIPGVYNAQGYPEHHSRLGIAGLACPFQ